MPEFKTEKIEFKNRAEVLRLHILIKCFEKGFNISSAEADCLVELYQNGYNTRFFDACLNKKLFKDAQCVRNSLTKMKKQGILIHRKRGIYEVDESLLPKTSNQNLIFQYMIRNI